MLLRTLVTQWVRQTAQQKLLEAVSEATRQAQAGEGGDSERPSCDVIFLFALAVEAGGMVDLLDQPLTRRSNYHVERLAQLDERLILVAEGGTGGASMRRLTQHLIQRYQPAWVVCSGFATALQADVRRGNIVLAERVGDDSGNELSLGLGVDARTLPTGVRVGKLLSVDEELKSPSRRQELGARWQALAGDMESFAVASVCRELGTRFLAARIVTDTVEDQLPPELEAVLHQRSVAGKLGAAAAALWGRPSTVKQMWNLKEEALMASDRLARFLRGMIGQLPAKSPAQDAQDAPRTG